MKTGTTLVTTLFTLASFPLLAQQPPPSSQPNRPPTQQNPPGAEPQYRVIRNAPKDVGRDDLKALFRAALSYW